MCLAWIGSRVRSVDELEIEALAKAGAQQVFALRGARFKLQATISRSDALG